jgi:hypothetical protein
MARKQRSYFAKSNKGKAGEVFLNNVLASSSANAKKKAKASASATKAANQAARRAKSAAKAKAKESIRRANARMRENERDQKRMQVYTERIIIELEKIGLYISNSFVSSMATKAINAEITPAKISSYFIKGNETKLSEETAIAWMEEQCFDDGGQWVIKNIDGYKTCYYLDTPDLDIFKNMRKDIWDTSSEQKALLKVITDCRPQSDAINHPLFQNLIKRYKNFEDIVEDLLDIDWSQAKMFSYDVIPFLRLCIDNKWTLDEATCSEEYVNLTSKKMLYYEDLVNQSKCLVNKYYATSSKIL